MTARSADLPPSEAFRALAEMAPTAMLLVDSEGRIRWLNRAALQLFGYEKQELLGESVEILVPERDRMVHRRHRQRFFADPAVQAMAPYREVRARRRGGDEVPVLVRLGLAQTMQGPIAQAIVIEPGADQRALVEALRENQRRLALLQDTVFDAVFEVSVEPDGGFRFVSANQNILPFSGLELDHLIGRRVEELLPPSLYAAASEKFREAIATGSLVHWVATLERPGGTLVKEVHVVPIPDDDGHCRRLLGAIHDISALRAAEAELHRLNAELESRVRQRTAQLSAINEEVEAFTYAVSHDLRAPLRAIDGFSQALLEDYGDRLDAVGQDYLRRVRGAVERMTRLIDDLLKLSRLTRGELRTEPVDLSAMARAIAEELHAAHPERQVTFSIADGLVAPADPTLIRSVLENLLGNAWKFSRNVSHARIEFGRAMADSEVAYFVRDNGAGFDMAYADRLFGPFQRLHSTEEFEGHGIGLATVKRIVHRHGGRVWAEGRVGAGATFWFTLGERGGTGSHGPEGSSAGRGQPRRRRADAAGAAQEPRGQRSGRGA